MAILIGIMGDFGTGKSTSAENLDSLITLYINYLGMKDLNFKGARKKYKVGVSDNVIGSNLINSPPASLIPTLITSIPQLSRFKIGILDDISYTMTNDLKLTAIFVNLANPTCLAVSIQPY